MMYGKTVGTSKQHKKPGRENSRACMDKIDNSLCLLKKELLRLLRERLTEAFGRFPELHRQLQH
jgi:hypothetical protein